MKKKMILVVALTFILISLFAQDKEEKEKQEEKKGFKKENLFTGGSITLSFLRMIT